MERRARAYFLDRDGVVVEEVGLSTRREQLRVAPGVVDALRTLDERGYLAVLVTNQTVVSRGLVTEGELGALHQYLSDRLQVQGAPAFAGVYVCPHHPDADVADYRVDCDCRKPRPGLLYRAADDLGIALEESVMVGDRLSDVAAGKAAGCTTVLIESGAHEAPPIVGMTDEAVQPDYRFASLGDAVAALTAT